MTVPANLTVDQVSWHTRVRGNPESREEVIQRFTAFANFLDRNGLTVKPLLPVGTVPNDSFAIRVGDLTDEGLDLIKKAYDKWIRRIDKGHDCTDVSILERALDKLREKKRSK